MPEEEKEKLAQKIYSGTLSKVIGIKSNKEKVGRFTVKQFNGNRRYDLVYVNFSKIVSFTIENTKY